MYVLVYFEWCTRLLKVMYAKMKVNHIILIYRVLPQMQKKINKIHAVFIKVRKVIPNLFQKEDTCLWILKVIAFTIEKVYKKSIDKICVKWHCQSIETEKLASIKSLHESLKLKTHVVFFNTVQVRSVRTNKYGPLERERGTPNGGERKVVRKKWEREQNLRWKEWSEIPWDRP